MYIHIMHHNIDSQINKKSNNPIKKRIMKFLHIKHFLLKMDLYAHTLIHSHITFSKAASC
jgi:hypothetical protein